MSLLRRINSQRRHLVPNWKVASFLGIGATLVLTGCLVGPDYQRPSVDVPGDWRWKVAEPSDDVPRGDWWTVFEDPLLDLVIRKAPDPASET